MQHRVTGSVQIQNGQTVAFDFIPVSVAIVVDANAPLFGRGVEADAITSIVELRGNFWTADFEQKFYQAVNAIKTSKPF
jgi:hypothetical protein